MTAFLRAAGSASGLARFIAALMLASSLAACGGSGVPFGRVPGDQIAPAQKADAASPSGPVDVIGSGPVKVGLILPLTQASGGASVVGVAIRNSAELALADAGANDLTLIVKDDHSTPEGARAAAQEALADGADLIIGPLFAPSVREVGRLAHASGKAVIAFSTDSSAAGHGVYLLSFLVESYVDRIIDFTAAKGKKSIAALIPENDYGRVAEAAFQQAAARNNIRVMTIEHYTPQTIAAAAQKIAALGDQIDALFIPEQADAMPAVSQALVAAGFNGKKAQLLGTGLWNDARVLKLPALEGAWFSAPENGGFNAFAGRYRGKYGVDPPRIATLSYDAVSLAAALARTQGSQRYSDNVITNRSGFNGADGVFRFRADGANDRGLAVLEIGNGAAAPISPAPHSFSGVPSAI
jgi:hypothetical protein